MAQTEGKVTWLTQEAYGRLKAELDHLAGPGRIEISKKIELAREEGDLRENGGYHAAKEEQGKQEARIRQLQALLENAQVGQAPPDDGVVEPGMLVTARVGETTITFLLGPREISAGQYPVYSEASPLGAAILGKRAGQSAVYHTPAGKDVTVAVLEATPFSG
ncbi:MAG: transcription elongation factor GreA [Actinomycetes bacterium]